MSKIAIIDTTESLLAAFVRCLEEHDEAEPEIRAALLSGGGAELRLEALNQKFQFTIHPHLYPSRKVFDQGLLDKGRPVVLLCPHLPDELASDCRKRGLNHADLNGRLFIKTTSYLLDRQPGQRRTYRNPVSEPDLFSLKTSRILRALLSHRDREWTQEELGQHTQLSPGLISRILKTLVTHGHVARERAAPEARSRARYHLQEFDRLLDAWKSGDDWRKRVQVQQYSALNNDLPALAKDVRDALGEERVCFTQWFAAHLRHPYTNPPLASAYFKGKQAPNLTFARKVQTGGNLWLIIPADEGVFLDVQQVQGFNLVSDVQIYLDLLQVGQRGPDQAEALRQWEGFAR